MSWSWQQAMDAMAEAEREQQNSEQEIRDRSVTAADAKRHYEVELHKRIVTLRAEGVAATACERLAKGQPDIADLRHARDVAEGMLTAAKAASYRYRDNRADTLQLARWAQSREIADGSIRDDKRLSWTAA